MKFKEWFYTEVGTSTASIAVFARPVFGGAITRTWPPSIADSEFNSHEHHKKKKKKKKED